MNLPPPVSHITLKSLEVANWARPLEFDCIERDFTISFGGFCPSQETAVSQSGCNELPTESSTVSNRASKPISNFDFQTQKVPIVVKTSDSRLGDEGSLGCFLYQIGSNLYTTFTPMISSSLSEDEDINETIGNDDKNEREQELKLECEPTEAKGSD